MMSMSTPKGSVIDRFCICMQDWEVRYGANAETMKDGIIRIEVWELNALKVLVEELPMLLFTLHPTLRQLVVDEQMKQMLYEKFKKFTDIFSM